MGARADDVEGIERIDEGASGEMGLAQVDAGIGKAGEIGGDLLLDPALLVPKERRRSLERQTLPFWADWMMAVSAQFAGAERC